MIRVVVTGSECTGKTTLARALAAHYQVGWAPEYAREFVDRARRAPEVEDVEKIARGQIANEELAAQAGGALLILDTDLLSTVVYSRHYYGSCPGWVEGEARGRLADLYLLTGLDVAWAPDGDQRDRGDDREAMQESFRRVLSEHGAESCVVTGPVEERLGAARAAIEALRAPS